MNMVIGNKLKKAASEWNRIVDGRQSDIDNSALVSEIYENTISEDYVEGVVDKWVENGYVEEEIDSSIPGTLLFENNDLYAEIARIAKRMAKKCRIK